ncbi:MAG TPA: ATP-binding protein [Polyangiales bacterium]|nr:ATP-binding protein [Polyangiales bacterium]
MKLSARFVLLVGALVAAVAASRHAGHTALAHLDTALQEMVRGDVARLLSITHTRRLFRSMVVQELDYVLAKSDGERESSARRISEIAAKLDTELKNYEQLMPAEDSRSAAELRSARLRWLDEDTHIRQTAQADPDEALLLAKEHALDRSSWEQLARGLIEANEKRVEERARLTHRAYLEAESQLFAVSVIAAGLAAVFGSIILIGIRKNVRELVALKDNLEEQVKARTALLAARERALTLVLDSTGDGLIEVGRDTRLTGVCSVAAVRWFGPAAPGTLVTDYLLAADPAQAAQFSTAIKQLVDDVVPWELCREHMPRRFVRGGLTLELDFKRVIEAGSFGKVLLVVRDVSDTSRSDRAVKSDAEPRVMLAMLLDDKNLVTHNVRECEATLAALSECDDETAMRGELANVKVCATKLGMRSVVAQTERILNRRFASPALRAVDIADLSSLWHARMRDLERFVIDRGLSSFRGTANQDAACERLFERFDCEELLGFIEQWARRPAAERLARLRAHAEHHAEQAGKTIHVTIEHNNLSLAHDSLEKFWPTLIHVVRNVVEHAAESPEARSALGKPAALTLTLATYQTPEGLLIELRDDGPGIDRDALLRSARLQNSHLSSVTALRDLVFMEGVSSHADIGATARGHGLAPVRRACDAEGGTLNVSSEPRLGTTFQFRFRVARARPQQLATRLLRRSTLRPVAANSSAERSQPTAATPARGVR